MDTSYNIKTPRGLYRELDKEISLITPTKTEQAKMPVQQKISPENIEDIPRYFKPDLPAEIIYTDTLIESIKQKSSATPNSKVAKDIESILNTDNIGLLLAYLAFKVEPGLISILNEITGIKTKFAVKQYDIEISSAMIGFMCNLLAYDETKRSIANTFASELTHAGVSIVGASTAIRGLWVSQSNEIDRTYDDNQKINNKLDELNKLKAKFESSCGTISGNIEKIPALKSVVDAEKLNIINKLGKELEDSKFTTANELKDVNDERRKLLEIDNSAEIKEISAIAVKSESIENKAPNSNELLKKISANYEVKFSTIVKRENGSISRTNNVSDADNYKLTKESEFFQKDQIILVNKTDNPNKYSIVKYKDKDNWLEGEIDVTNDSDKEILNEVIKNMANLNINFKALSSPEELDFFYTAYSNKQGKIILPMETIIAKEKIENNIKFYKDLLEKNNKISKEYLRTYSANLQYFRSKYDSMGQTLNALSLMTTSNLNLSAKTQENDAQKKRSEAQMVVEQNSANNNILRTIREEMDKFVDRTLNLILQNISLITELMNSLKKYR